MIISITMAEGVEPVSAKDVKVRMLRLKVVGGKSLKPMGSHWEINVTRVIGPT